MAQLKDVIRPLFVTGLQNVHAVEHQALALLKRQVEHLAHYPEIETRLRSHIDETHDQIGRVEQILEAMGEKHSALKDAALNFSGNLAVLGHALAADEVIKNTLANYMFENFEVASYTGLIVMAEDGGFDGALGPLRRSLEEERAMAQFVIDHLPAVTRTFIARRAAGKTADH